MSCQNMHRNLLDFKYNGPIILFTLSNSGVSSPCPYCEDRMIFFFYKDGCGIVYQKCHTLFRLCFNGTSLLPCPFCFLPPLPALFCAARLRLVGFFSFFFIFKDLELDTHLHNLSCLLGEYHTRTTATFFFLPIMGPLLFGSTCVNRGYSSTSISFISTLKFTSSRRQVLYIS